MSVFQTVGEKISVTGTYEKAAFVPQTFNWNHQDYLIDEITLISDIHHGDRWLRMYSFMAGNRLFRVLFDRKQETWILEELWCE